VQESSLRVISVAAAAVRSSLRQAAVGSNVPPYITEKESMFSCVLMVWAVSPEMKWICSYQRFSLRCCSNPELVSNKD